MTTEPGLALLLRALQDWQRTKHKPWPRWSALCPVHDDHTPSLMVDCRVPPSWPDDEPTVLVYCRICKANLLDVCKALGIKAWDVLQGNDLWDEEVMGEPPPPALLPSHAMLVAWRKRLLVMPEPLAYLKEQRGLNEDTIRRYCIGWDFRRYTVPVRGCDGSVVNLRRYLPGGEPKWLPLAGRSVKHLYPYPYFPAARSVLLCEGELDALIARQHGLPAVTCIGGVGTWNPDWNPAFAGRHVAIVYDCDAAGREYARRRQAEMWGVAASVRVIDLALQDKEDLTDWFVTYNRTADDLKSLIRATPIAGNETPNVRRLAARTKGIKKAPATERQPGLSSAPRAKETTY